MTASQTILFFILIYIFSSYLISFKFQVSKSNLKSRINVFNILGIVILTLVPGIQFANKGTDVYTYQVVFYNINQTSWKKFIDASSEKLGFYSVAKLSYSIGGRILTFSVLSFLIVVFFYLFLKNNELNISGFVASLVFLTGIYSTGAFNILKQGVAASIVLYATKYIFNDNFLKYLFWIVVAFFFHSTAIVCILFYFLWDHNNDQAISNMKEFLYIGLSIVAIFAYQSLISFLSTTFTYFYHYDRYTKTIDSTNRDFYIYFFELILLIMLRSKIYKLDRRNKYMMILLFIAVAISFTGFFNPFVKRIATYFYVPARIMLLSSLPNVFDEKDKKVVTMVLTIYLLCLWALVRVIISNWTYNFELSNIPY